MRLTIYIVLICSIAIACQEPFEPEVEAMESFLVVEGRITTDPGENIVYISQSKPFANNPYFVGKAGYTVYLTDQDEERFNYIDLNNGSYQVSFVEEDLPEVGDTYTLHIISPEGDEYVSRPQEIVTSPQLSNLYCDYGERDVLEEDAYGNPREVLLTGLDLYLETNGIYPVNNHYIYDYRGYEQHHTVIQIGIFTYHLYRHRRLNTRFGTKVKTVSADDFGELLVRRENFLFLSWGDILNYKPQVADTIEIINTRFEGAVFKLRQFSISPDVYNFYNSVEDQLLAEGRMFDPAVPQITGNIYCVSDTTIPVAGVFAASDVSIRFAYFHMDYRGRHTTRQIDSFPELWVDTCSWGIPDSWILPPY